MLAPERYQNKLLKIRKLITMSGEPLEFGMEFATETKHDGR